MGRKKKKPSEKKSNLLRVMMTDKDRAAIEKAAATEGLEASTFVRVKILELIRKATKP